MTIRSFGLSVAAGLLGGLAGAGELPAPRHLWTFDKLGWDSRKAVDLGSDDNGFELNVPGRIVPGHGTDGSDALAVDADRRNTCRAKPLDYGAFTLDLRFRLSDAPDGKTAQGLWGYCAGPSDKGSISVLLTADGRLNVVAGSVFSAASEPLGLTDDVLHSLRLAVTSGGQLAVWMDGWQVIAKAGAPSFASLEKGRGSDGFPVLSVGCVLPTLPGVPPSVPMTGVLDDIAVYDVALGAPPPAAVRTNYANVPTPEYKSQSAARAEVLLLNAGGKGSTDRFRILDHEEGVLGQMKTADEKFVRAAASATFALSDVSLEVVFDCPVPPGLKPNVAKDVWSGDRVEFFIRPKADDRGFILYAVNAGGLCEVHRFKAPGSRMSGWKSKVVANVEKGASGYRVELTIPRDEVFVAPLQAGDAFGVNFVRHGPTAGGDSPWAVAGGSFSDGSIVMGTAIWGGAKEFFKRRIVATAKRAVEACVDAEGRKRAHDVCKLVANAVTEHAGEADSFGALEQMLSDLERALVQIANGGRPLLFYRPADVWGSAVAPDLSSRPLEVLRVKAPRNVRTITAFAAANLRDAEFLGQLKMQDRSSGLQCADRYFPLPADAIAKRFTLRRGFPVWDRNGHKIYDPVEELPNGTVVRLAPGEVAPLYLELDTHGLAAGRYYTRLYAKRAAPGYRNESIAVEVEVVDADLDAVKADKAGYSHFGVAFRKARRPCPNIIRKMAERGYTFILCEDYDWLPRCDEKGVWQEPDYGMLDRLVDAWFKGGLDPSQAKLWIYLGVDDTKMSWTGFRDAKGRRVPFGTELWDAGLRFMVESVCRHVKSRFGIGRDRIWWYPVDEPNGEVDDPTFKSRIAQALHAAKVIKSVDPANLTMTDPLPDFLASPGIEKAMPRLAEVYDAIQLYRPYVTEKTKALVKASGVRQLWSYSIIGKDTPALKYRMDFWRNMADGYREIATFWHMDETAGGDAFDSTDCGAPGLYMDYATLYADYDNDDFLLSRRQLATDQAAEECRLILFLRRKFANDPTRLASIEDIVRKAVGTGTMAALDEAYVRLLDEARKR